MQVSVRNVRLPHDVGLVRLAGLVASSLYVLVAYLQSSTWDLYQYVLYTLV